MTEPIDHADQVTNADVVQHADVVENHHDEARAPRARPVLTWLDIGIKALIAFAILVGALGIYSMSRTLAARSAKTTCEGLYASRVSIASAKNIAQVGNLIVVVADQTLTPEVRTAKITEAVVELGKTSTRAQQVALDRDAYLKAGSPTPCPISQTDA